MGGPPVPRAPHLRSRLRQLNVHTSERAAERHASHKAEQQQILPPECQIKVTRTLASSP
jgi:hypothetical protein